MHQIVFKATAAGRARYIQVYKWVFIGMGKYIKTTYLSIVKKRHGPLAPDLLSLPTKQKGSKVTSAC
jgi:hypothetical protein